MYLPVPVTFARPDTLLDPRVRYYGVVLSRDTDDDFDG